MESERRDGRPDSEELGQRSGKGVQPLSRTIRWLKLMATGHD